MEERLYRAIHFEPRWTHDRSEGGGGASEMTGVASFGSGRGSFTRTESGTRRRSRWDRRDGVLRSDALRKPGEDADGIIRRPRAGWRSRGRGGARGRGM